MKKKNKVIISFLMVLAIILAVPSMTAFAETDGGAEVLAQVGSTSYLIQQGDTFTTTVYIADNANIIDFDMHLLYDTDMLTLIGAEEHEDMKGSVGAGDAFCAGCLYALYHNYSQTQMLEFASAAAACSLLEANSIDGMKPRNEILALAEKYGRLQ